MRGCKKPGFNLEQQGAPFRYTSPALIEVGEDVLTECPVGKILREAPHVYDLTDHLSHADKASPREMEGHSRYFRHALRLYRAELSRLDDLRRARDRAAGDAAIGARMLRGS